jgi:ActR/RegA family two-component response regulator
MMLAIKQMTAKPLVVVIEDDLACADALGLILDDWGAEVVVGGSAAEIAATLGLRSASVGWIITDFNLGDGPDGITGLRPLTLAAPRARILVLSGSFRGQAAKAAQAAGLDVMSKPADRDAIVTWLERT